MFRRSKTEEPAPAILKEGGKGRPTPTRREAEAAAKARARGVADKKAAARQQRSRRTEGNARAREGMRRGEEQYLPRRDKGPVRRFVRDWIDSRLCMAELVLPLLLVIVVVGSFAPRLTGSLYSVSLLLVAVDTTILVLRLRRDLRRRFPDQSTKGAVGYSIMRSLQVRFLRLPKPQVKLGAKLPQRY